MCQDKRRHFFNSFECILVHNIIANIYFSQTLEKPTELRDLTKLAANKIISALVLCILNIDAPRTLGSLRVAPGFFLLLDVHLYFYKDNFEHHFGFFYICQLKLVTGGV